MKISRIVPFVYLFLLCWGAQVQVEAQVEAPPMETPPAQIPPAEVPPPTEAAPQGTNPGVEVPAGGNETAVVPVTVAEMSQLCANGFYDEAITLASQPIEAAQGADPPGKIDPLLFYWRGLAELRVGWFGHARDDMMAAVKAGVVVKNETPQSVLQKIERIEAVLPPEVFEVKNGNDTIFRVYYTQNDAVTQAIIDTLPAAYRISADLLGADLIEQPVFIFNTFVQMQAFMQARGNVRPTSWSWAYGSRDAFYFCLENPQGQPVASFKESYVRATVAHEYNHALFQRAMGNVKVPNWFFEGTAMMAGSRIDRESEMTNDYTLGRLLVTEALVVPQSLETQAAFNGYTEVGQAMTRAGLGKLAADPYAQSFNMTRFLMANLPANGFPDFLNQIREAKSFDVGLQNQFGLSLPEFYERWYAVLRKKMQ